MDLIAKKWAIEHRMPFYGRHFGNRFTVLVESHSDSDLMPGLYNLAVEPDGKITFPVFD